MSLNDVSGSCLWSMGLAMEPKVIGYAAAPGCESAATGKGTV